MVKRLGGLSAVVLIMALVAAACGGDDPTPTPIVIEKEVQVIVTATPTALPPTPTPIDPDTVEAEFLLMTGLAGQSFFVEAYREMLERGTNGRITLQPRDAELRATAIDYINNRPDQYTRILFWQNEQDLLLHQVGFSFTGGAPLDPPPLGTWQAWPVACSYFLTLDPDIKTVQDLVGKRVHGGNPGHPWLAETEIILKAAGIRDQVTVIQGGKDRLDALSDREVDASIGANLSADTDQSASGSVPHRLAQITGTFRAIGFSDELLEEARRQNPTWDEVGLLFGVPMQPGSMNAAFGIDYDPLDGRVQNCIGGVSVVFATSPETEEPLVYAMTKAIVENLDVADDFFPFVSEIWKERMAHAWMEQKFFHPGARRAYEEAGVTYGIEGIEEWRTAKGLPSLFN